MSQQPSDVGEEQITDLGLVLERRLELTTYAREPMHEK